jgi:hypothetical protein
MKRPHLTALICLALAALLFALFPSPQYAGAFALLAIFFELAAWKQMLDHRKSLSKTRSKP